MRAPTQSRRCGHALGPSDATSSRRLNVMTRSGGTVAEAGAMVRWLSGDDARHATPASVHRIARDATERGSRRITKSIVERRTRAAPEAIRNEGNESAVRIITLRPHVPPGHPDHT